MKPRFEDVEYIKDIKGIKRGATAIKLLEKNLNNNTFNKIKGLPSSEFKNTLRIILELFKTAYQRQKSLHDIENRYDKWWFNDLSDNNYIEKLNYLTSLPGSFYRLKDKNVKIEILEIERGDHFLISNDIDKILKRLEIQFLNYHVGFDGFKFYKLVNDSKISLVSLQETLDIEPKKIPIECEYECFVNDIVVNDQLAGKLIICVFPNNTNELKNVSKSVYSKLEEYSKNNYFDTAYQSYESDTISLLSLNTTIFRDSREEITLSI